MAADGFLVRPFQQAIHRAVAVVVELDLADPELVGPCVAGLPGQNASTNSSSPSLTFKKRARTICGT
jgi:hypothetical protein